MLCVYGDIDYYLQVKCIEFALAIAYVVLVLGLVGWALFHQPRDRRAASDREPLLKSMDEDEANSANMQYDENLALKVNDDSYIPY